MSILDISVYIATEKHYADQPRAGRMSGAKATNLGRPLETIVIETAGEAGHTLEDATVDIDQVEDNGGKSIEDGSVE